MEKFTTTSKLLNSSTDHVPIIANITREDEKIPKRKSITKRSTKNFTKQSWCQTLKELNSDIQTPSTNLDELVNSLDIQVKKALDI